MRKGAKRCKVVLLLTRKFAGALRCSGVEVEDAPGAEALFAPLHHGHGIVIIAVLTSGELAAVTVG